MTRYRINGTHLVVDGRPQIPVTGEAHYSRIPTELWPIVLGQVRSLGATIVSSYVFWNHHQPAADHPPSFEGQLNLAEFVRLAHSHGLDFCLRMGPWVHGESRYGGLPDWVATGPWQTRTDDPAYLDLVGTWFRTLAEHLDGLPIAIQQIENELCHQPEHLRTLKKLAEDSGLHADLTTATAWGGAQFDRSLFAPLYGGYPDTFWSPHSLGWEPQCAIHYQFQSVRDDALIGADGRSFTQQPVDDSAMPYATCELGGGMTTAYHRRPTILPADVGALGLTKIGCGSVWQGWYMLAGGVNPVIGDHEVHESRHTGYPNDLPLRDYDFSAPIGAAGQLRGSAAMLRWQHGLLASLGEGLATSTVQLADDGRTSIRQWRSPLNAAQPSGQPASALVFFNQHQPHTPLGDRDEVQVVVTDDGGHQTLVPPRRVRIAAGEFGAWAANLDLGNDVRLISSDLMPIMRLDHDQPTWVLVQTLADSVSATFTADDAPVAVSITPGTPLTIPSRAGGVRLLVLDHAEAATAWPIEGRLWFSPAALISTPAGLAVICDPVSSGAPVRELTPTGWATRASCPELISIELSSSDTNPARVTVPDTAQPWDRLTIRWRGNGLRVVVADEPSDKVSAVLADQFWHGDGELTIAVAHLAGHRDLDLHLSDYAADEHLVADQPDSCGIDSVSWAPVRVRLLADL